MSKSSDVGRLSDFLLNAPTNGPDHLKDVIRRMLGLDISIVPFHFDANRSESCAMSKLLKAEQRLFSNLLRVLYCKQYAFCNVRAEICRSSAEAIASGDRVVSSVEAALLQFRIG